MSEEYYEGMFGSLKHNILLMLSQIEGNIEYAEESSCKKIIKDLEFIKGRIDKINSQEKPKNLSADGESGVTIEKSIPDSLSTNYELSEVEFLEAMTKWGSWERMSKFAKANILNRIRDLKAIEDTNCVKEIVEKWANAELEKFGFGKDNPKIQYLIMLLTNDFHGRDFIKQDEDGTGDKE